MKTLPLCSLIFCTSIALGFAAPASAAQQAAAPSSCHEAVTALTSEWDAIDYPEPSKPMQAHVIGRLGYENSGSDVNYMRAQVRMAVRDCAEGDEAQALHRVASVRALLDPHPSTELGRRPGTE